MEKARPVDFKANPVDVRSVLTASIHNMDFDVTHDKSLSYGKTPETDPQKPIQNWRFQTK